MFDDCCKTGFRWEGQPIGTEGVLADLPAYITGTNKESAVLLIHDLFGWKFENLRLLADHYAQEANATVYLPDFYGGEVIPHDELAEALLSPKKMQLLDLPTFMSRHTKEIRYPEMLSCAQALKSQHGHKRVGTVGFCWGGWGCFRLAGEAEKVVDCMVVAHPSLVTEEEIMALRREMRALLIAPEFDTQTTKERRELYNRLLPEKGLDYRFEFYPGLAHGFSVRGNREDKVQREGLERAKRSAVSWFNEWLH